ncbi:methyl-accepting chemotaxis protein [Motiliproteus sp. MSK22-1]|uniref:methyl-accepting chemotaxis protein n=1 Tax=Motiliproteus sp. MSK22-1 TaxID=1897630 RepID=UPI0009776864|nr:methyl-accepting chemotaxis protein [Motiliproteus sp. MSK22-1]OMH38254.1 hypothetical protein BGP75_08370 [Motiliproteus sp. MSK22-1]
MSSKSPILDIHAISSRSSDKKEGRSLSIKNLSIKIRLVLMVGLLLMLSFVIVGGTSIYKAREVIEQRMMSDELPNLLRRVAGSIDREIFEILSAGRSLADNQFLADWVVNGESTASRQDVIEQLKLIKKEYGADLAFMITADQGSYFTDKGFFKQLNRSDSRDDWFYRFVDSGRRYEMAFDQDELTGDMKAFVNYRVTRSGETLAVVGIGVDVSEVISLVTEQRVATDGRLLLVEGNGEVRVHADAIRNQKNLSLSQLVSGTGMSDQLLQSDQFTFVEFQRQNQSYLMASTPIPTMDWYLVAELPRESIFSQIDNAFVEVLTVICVISLLMLLPVLVISGRVAAPIRSLAKLLSDIGQGEGDLRHRLEVRGTDEVGQLAVGFNTFVSKIQLSVSNVDKLSQEVGHILEGLRLSADSSHQDCNQQQQQLLVMSSAIEEMRATVQEIALSAREASSASAQVQQQAGEGITLIDKAGTQINCLSNDIEHAGTVVSELNSRVMDIGQLLAVIREVADQTNLLALNAAIEAARAGEQGRGFAVVADEVRTLALRSNELTDNIQQHVGTLRSGSESAMAAMKKARQGSDESVDITREAGATFAAIGREISQLSDRNSQVAEALNQQSEVVETLAENASSMSESGDRTLEAAEQVAQACTSLNDVAIKLRQNMDQFKY